MRTPSNAYLPPLSRLVSQLDTPPIPFVQAWAKAYDGSSGPLIDLSQAVPGYPPPDSLLDALSRAAGDPALAGYGLIPGEPDLRTAFSDYLREKCSSDAGPGNLQVTAGCNQAFVVTLLSIAEPGDAVLLTNPCFFNHETSVAMLGMEPRFVDCHAADRFHPSASRVAAALDDTAKGKRIRAVVLVSPNNPTGAVYPPDTLRAIREVCRARGVWLVVDETYRDFVMPQPAPGTHLLADPDWHEDTIILYSFSKVYCIPGHRVGAIIAAPRLIEQASKVMDNLQICAPRHAQHAIAVTMPTLTDWRTENNNEIARRAEAFADALSRAEGWEISASGAYFAYVRHPLTSTGSTDVAERLAREAGVVCLPGEFFGKGQSRYLRFAFANVSAERLSELPGRLEILKGRGN